MFSIQVDIPVQTAGMFDAIKVNKSDLVFEGGKAVQELIAQHMRNLNTTRSRHGSNHYNPNLVFEPEVNGDSANVGVGIAGISRAYHDLIIKPVEAKALAIPLHESAYGIQPREWNMMNPKGSKDTLFKLKGKPLLARNDNGNLVVMYVLKNEVTVRQDPSIMPSDNDMADEALYAIADAVNILLGK